MFGLMLCYGCLEILNTFGTGSLAFSCCTGSCKSGASPAPTLLPARGERVWLRKEIQRERRWNLEVVLPGPAIPEGMENFQVHQGWVPTVGSPAGPLLAPHPKHKGEDRGTWRLWAESTTLLRGCLWGKAFGAEGTARKGTGSQLERDLLPAPVQGGLVRAAGREACAGTPPTPPTPSRKGLMLRPKVCSL